MYFYESHMGGVYSSEEELDYEMLYCDSCGDSDREIGYAETFEEAWNLIKNRCSILGSGGIALQDVYPTIAEAFGVKVPFPIDDYGMVEASDSEILREINKICPIHIFSYEEFFEDDEDSMYLKDCLLADNIEEAKKLAPEKAKNVRKVSLESLAK